MISRAARRTRSERKSLSSPWPLINAFKRSRVRSDAGILSIGVLLRQRPVARPDLVDSPIRRRCTPTLFPAILGLHPAVAAERCGGTERWAAKTVTDPDASNVDRDHIRNITVAELNQLPQLRDNIPA